jgi:hypothetical protein
VPPNPATTNAATVPTPPTPTLPPAPAPALAKLFLEIRPADAAVEIDGASVALAALAAGHELPADTPHAVKVSAADHRPQEFTLSLTAGQEEKRAVALDPRTFLKVVSTPPGAAVTVDGRDSGTTPVTLEDLDLGEHTVGLSLPDYDPASRAVTLTKEAPRRDVDVSLARAKIAQAPTTTKVAPTTTKVTPTTTKVTPTTTKVTPTTTKTTPTPTPTPTKGGQGTVIVSTQPWGRVFVDGRNTGRTTPILPSNPLKLSAGRHTLKIVINSGQEFPIPVTVVAGQQTKVVKRLTP